VLVTPTSIIGVGEGGGVNIEWRFTNREPRHSLARSFDSAFGLLLCLNFCICLSCLIPDNGYGIIL
jgi:hypothetical protein